MFDNLMKGRPARSLKPQENVRDFPKPIRPNLSGHNKGTKEVGSTRQAHGLGHEEFREQLKRMFEQVSTLAQKGQRSAGNDDDIRNVIRTEPDERIYKMSKGQPGIASPVEALPTLSRDTNALLKNQLPPPHETQGVAFNAEHTAMENADKRRNNYSKRVTRSFATIRNRRYEDSSESGSDDIDDAFMMDDDHITRTGRQHEISLFGRRKGPQHEELTVIKTSDPAYDRFMNYRYYRLINTNHLRLAEKSKKLLEQVKTFQATIESTKFSGGERIMVFDFFTAFVEEADTLGVSEAHACLIMLKLLSSRAERHLRSIRNGARSGGVTCWPEVVNHFLCTYATPAATRNAVNNLRNIRQQPREDELTYSGRVNDAAHSCENVHNEIDKMTLFLHGLLRTIQAVVAGFRESRTVRRLSYEELVQYVEDEGESHPARTTSLRVAKWVDNRRHEQLVHFFGRSSSDERTIVGDDRLYVTDDDSIYNKGPPSPGDTPCSQPLYCVGRPMRYRHPTLVKPKQIPPKTKTLSQTAPGG